MVPIPESKSCRRGALIGPSSATRPRDRTTNWSLIKGTRASDAVYTATLFTLPAAGVITEFSSTPLATLYTTYRLP